MIGDLAARKMRRTEAAQLLEKENAQRWLQEKKRGGG